MNVYELVREEDEQGFNRYQQLIVDDWKMSKTLGEYESRDGWFSNRQPIGEAWFPIKVEEWEHTYSHIPGDYPILGGFPGYPITPIFSQRAVDALADLLEGNGELLPLICDSGEYYAFNITREVDALDEERSEFKRFSELYMLMVDESEPDPWCISRYEFHPERIADLSIFKLLRTRHQFDAALVTDKFVQRVREADLKGFDFKLLSSRLEQPITAGS
jgi:hypothetical protein